MRLEHFLAEVAITLINVGVKKAEFDIGIDYGTDRESKYYLFVKQDSPNRLKFVWES